MGVKDAQLNDTDLSNVFVANGVPWMVPANRIIDDENLLAAGASRIVGQVTPVGRGGFAGRGGGHPAKRGRGGY